MKKKQHVKKTTKKRAVRKPVKKVARKPAKKNVSQEAPKSEIKFGTDGWRAVIADTFTFKNVSIVAQAFAEWVNKEAGRVDGRKRIAVGFDTRFMSGDFAQVVSSVLAANGIEVLISDSPLPTPALSLAVVNNRCVA